MKFSMTLSKVVTVGVVFSLQAVHIWAGCEAPAHLCGNEPTYVSLPGFSENAVQLFDAQWDPCCTLQDTRPPGCDEISIYDDATRIYGTQDAICEGDDCECGEFEEMTISISRSVRQGGFGNCCANCACFGDPQCISFTKVPDIWILCDGREDPEDLGEDGTCVITKNACEKQLDHAGRQCVWEGPERSGAQAQYNAERSWDIVADGSPCRPDPASGDSWFNMYTADSFKLDIEQGERGFIDEVQVQTADGTFSITAIDCFADEFKDKLPWTSDVTIPEWIEEEEVSKSKERFFTLRDPTTGIEVKIRCSANFRGSNKFVKRLNVENLVEPFADYQTKRTNLDGFCVDNIMDKTGTFNYTDYLINEDICFQNEGSNGQKMLRVARGICNNPAVTIAGIEACLCEFCDSVHTPGSSAARSCLKNLHPNNYNYDKIRNQLCKSISQGMEPECREFTNEAVEAEGIEGGFFLVTQKYLYNPVDSRPTECIDGTNYDVVELPECPEYDGFELQYYIDDTDTWVTYRAFPDIPVECVDENGQPQSVTSITFTCAEHEVLFRHRIRVIQKHQPETCNLDTCNSVDGFQITVIYIPPEDPTPRPTKSPTSSPTPTTPTCEPIWEEEGLLMDFSNAKEKENSLDSGIQRIVYEDIGRFDGKDMFLYISTTDTGSNPYIEVENADPGNGLSQSYAVINLKCNSQVDLEFSFKDEEEQSISVRLWDLSFVNIVTQDGMIPSVIVENAQVFLDDATLLEAETDGGETVITPTFPGTFGVPNEGPNELDEAQLKSAVTFRYASTSSTSVSLRMDGDCEGDQYGTFVIAGTTKLAPCI